ncbi:ATP-dependent helicase/deoxyribonuclease subunit B [Pediococcus damnosus]|uniref:PD-(D/E)XK nuclease family protein n=1 Tax=Pediococcus damnosus TaxID=51663 RepID=UPI001145110A|nr:PD-(D/E)XK nuclease family protein [Pediococcus damnosus]GEA92880.1 ATP-dependent helicase/deoxyribonuclease subunit B [Pediococcus damnosus]
MTLKFILGKASRDGQGAMIDQVDQVLSENSQNRVYYIVPNHVKFQSELTVLNELRKRHSQNSHTYAQNQLQVFSFSRLAWYFMKNEPIYQVPRLSKAGVAMLIDRIILEHQDELTVFNGEQTQPGFIQQLASQFDELQKGRISAEDLVNLTDEVNSNENSTVDLTAKMHDLSIIYTAFEEEMLGNYVDSNTLIQALCEYLATQDLSQMVFFFDSFSSLSAQEMKLVQVLIENAKAVVVGLVLDRPYYDKLPEPENLFYESGKTYFKLYQFAQAKHLQVQTDTYAKKSRVISDLVKLEDFWIKATNLEPTEVTTLSDQNAIQIFRADSRQTEVEQIARKIRQAVANNPQIHYRDFSILTRHLDTYATVLNPTFDEYEIPYFNDLQISMKDHPFVALIEALFAVKDHYYRYQDVMRLLKTELLIPTVDEQPMPIEAFRRAKDLTENLVLKNGYEGGRWLQKEDWQYLRFNSTDFGTQTDQDLAITKQINLIKNYIRRVLPPFFKALDNAKTGKEGVTVLYKFLIDQGVADRLKQWRDEAVDRGDLSKAAQPEQTWQTFCDMLDEYVAILGDREFTIDNFSALLKAGFEGASYSLIPSTLDQVMISETGMAQMGDRKYTFIMGATDAVMPEQFNNQGILTDDDCDKLQDDLKEDQFFASNNNQQAHFERYLNYAAFLSGCKGLILSYASSDGEGAEQKISPYVKEIKTHFQITDSQVLKYFDRPKVDEESVVDFLGSKRSTLTHLLQVSRDSKSIKKMVKPNWQYIYRVLNNDPQLGELTKRVFESLTYKNEPVKLYPEIVQGLYGDTINTSISKLEEFYQNEYAYFLKYGLKLQERNVFELSPASTGEYFHMALDHFVKLIGQQNLEINQLSDSELDNLLNEVVKTIKTEPQFEILGSSNRMHYINDQLNQTIKQMLKIFVLQSDNSKMRPVQTEVLFGHVGSEAGLHSLDFEVAPTKKVHVRGKIDRIDELNLTSENGQLQKYFGIVDYKSSDHDFNFRDIYYGLAMQMLTYIDALKQNINLIDQDKDSPLISGALYMHLQNPAVNVNKLRNTDSDTVQKELLKQTKYKGIILSDPDLLDNLDTKLDSGSSLIYPFKKNKAGKYSSYDNHIVTQEELTRLIKHAERKIVEASKKIFAGELKLNPARWPDTHTALQYSPYKSIMQFDEMLPENNYHKLENLSGKDVLAKLKEEDDEHGEK